MVQYKFLLTINKIDVPSSMINLKNDDNICGNFSLNINLIPSTFNGWTAAADINGSSGTCIIGNTRYEFNSFYINEDRIITSVTFMGDIDYMLKIDFDKKTFVLQGNDINKFLYSGIVDQIIIQYRELNAPTGVKIVVK